MDTKPYESDSPYTNLTLKYDGDYICKQNRIKRKQRIVSCMIGLSVFICVASCIVSCVCALYCLRASNAAHAVEDKLLSQAQGVGIPTAQPLRDVSYLDEPEYFDDDDDVDDADEEDYYDESFNDDNDYEDDDDEFDDDTDEEEDIVVDGDDWDSEEDDSNESGNADDIIDLDSVADISGYLTDDEDDSLEGSGLEDGKVMSNKLTLTPTTAAKSFVYSVTQIRLLDKNISLMSIQNDLTSAY